MTEEEAQAARICSAAAGKREAVWEMAKRLIDVEDLSSREASEIISVMREIIEFDRNDSIPLLLPKENGGEGIYTTVDGQKHWVLVDPNEDDVEEEPLVERGIPMGQIHLLTSPDGGVLEKTLGEARRVPKRGVSRRHTPLTPGGAPNYDNIKEAPMFTVLMPEFPFDDPIAWDGHTAWDEEGQTWRRDWGLFSIHGSPGENLFDAEVEEEARRRGIEVVQDTGFPVAVDDISEVSSNRSHSEMALDAYNAGLPVAKLPDRLGQPYFRWYLITPIKKEI